MKGKSVFLKLIAMTLAMILVLSCAFTSLALAEETDDKDNPIQTDDKPSEEKTEDNGFTEQNRKDAEALIKGLAPVECWHGDQNINGVIYHELYGDGKSQESTKDKSSADLFADLLTSPLSNGKNVIRDVWIYAAQAALLSGGYNKFYRVEDTYMPTSWDDAFWQWNTTACNWRGDQLFYNMPSGRGDLKHTDSFDTVGKAMLQLIKNQSDRIEWQLKDGLDTYDKALENWTAPENTGNGDIWYIPFTKVVYNKERGLRSSNDDHWPYFYDCFALCFYDFKLKQVDNEGKTGNSKSLNTTFEIINENDQAIGTWTNESDQPSALSEQTTKSKTTTTSTTLSASNTLSFTTGGSFQYTNKWGGGDIHEQSITIGINFSNTQSKTTGTSQTTGESKTVTQSYGVSGTMPPATQVTVIQSNALAKGAATCSAPVTFQYKVAVLSLCGYYSGQVIGQRDVEVTHAGTCRIFGEKTGDALADVQNRYNNKQMDDFNLDWHLDPPRDPAINQERFYANLGGAVTFFVTDASTRVTQPVPMFPLKATEVDKNDKEHKITYSDKNPGEINLSNLEVKGIAILKNGKNEAPYYGFSSKNGDWVLCDADNNPIEKSDYGHIEDRPTGTYFIADKVTDPSSPVYLMYVIDNNFYPKNPTEADPKEFLTNDDLAKDKKGKLRAATISVTITEPIEHVRPEDEIEVRKPDTAHTAKIQLEKKLLATPTAEKITVQWGKVDGAEKYKVYADYEGGDGYELVKTTKETSGSFKKLDKKKIKTTEQVRLYVVAIGNGGKELAKSNVISVAGVDNKKYTNAKSVKVIDATSKSAVTKVELSVKEKLKIQGSATPVTKGKKILGGFRYASSNPYVAKVNTSGKITAVGKGSCTVYVYAKNGLSANIKVTVK